MHQGPFWAERPYANKERPDTTPRIRISRRLKRCTIEAPHTQDYPMHPSLSVQPVRDANGLYNSTSPQAAGWWPRVGVVPTLGLWLIELESVWHALSTQIRFPPQRRPRSSNAGSYSKAIAQAKNTVLALPDCDECTAASPKTHHNLACSGRSSASARRESPRVGTEPTLGHLSCLLLVCLAPSVPTHFSAIAAHVQACRAPVR
jgi:hypothetical protein